MTSSWGCLGSSTARAATLVAPLDSLLKGSNFASERISHQIDQLTSKQASQPTSDLAYQLARKFASQLANWNIDNKFLCVDKNFHLQIIWLYHYFKKQKIPPKIVFFQLFLISSNFCPQIFDILLLETKTTLPSVKIYTRSFSTCFNHLQGP